MTNETEPITQNPAAALESDLADIRALLRQAVALGNNANKSAETRLAAMTAATRLFSAAAKGSEMIARLNGHVSQTRHTTVVEHEGIGPKKGQSHDEWWQSLSPEEQADLDRRVNAPFEKLRPLLIAEQEEQRAAEAAYFEARRQRLAGRGGPPEENPKTTSPAPPEPGDPDDIGPDAFDEPEET